MNLLLFLPILLVLCRLALSHSLHNMCKYCTLLSDYKILEVRNMQYDMYLSIRYLFFLCSLARLIYGDATRVTWVIVCILWIMTFQENPLVNGSSFTEI
jgi:hypothetical protein